MPSQANVRKMKMVIQDLPEILKKIQDDSDREKKNINVVYHIRMGKQRNPKNSGFVYYIPREKTEEFFAQIMSEQLKSTNNSTCRETFNDEKLLFGFQKERDGSGEDVFMFANRETYNRVVKFVVSYCEKKRRDIPRSNSDRQIKKSDISQLLQTLHDKNKGMYYIIYEIQLDSKKYPITTGRFYYVPRDRISSFYLNKINRQKCSFFAGSNYPVIRYFVGDSGVETLHIFRSQEDFTVLLSLIKRVCTERTSEAQDDFDGLNLTNVTVSKANNNLSLDGINFDALYSDGMNVEPIKFEIIEPNNVSFDGINFDTLYDNALPISSPPRIDSPINMSFDGINFDTLYNDIQGQNNDGLNEFTNDGLNIPDASLDAYTNDGFIQAEIEIAPRPIEVSSGSMSFDGINFDSLYN
jgi:hypothetical protein